MTAAVSLPTSPDVDLHHGDNVAVMRSLLPSLGGRVSLAYLDPPYLTGRDFAHRDGRFAFGDKWESRAHYIEALRERVSLVRELLAPHGCIIVHVDPRTSHYVKVMMDEVFGDDTFANEIIWHYRRWPVAGTVFQRMHDVLLRYRKSVTAEPRWTQLFDPLSETTKRRWKGRRQAVAVRPDGANDVSPGAYAADVWDIGVIAPVSSERTGYPTQKPEALLERIITSMSAAGDIVLDPYMGSGTTGAVAHRLGRHFVGIDASDVAIETARQRLR